MIDIDMKKLAERIKDLREENHLSQKDLAIKIGVAQNTISQYEQGTAKPSIEILANLAVALNTSTDYLLGLKDWE